MLNRRFVLSLTTLLAVLLLAVPALAQGTKKYAVFPFTYNGPKKYSYFPKAFQASLNNDLEWPGHAEPAGDSVIDGVATPSGTADSIKTLRSIGIDYLVTGSIAILDREANLKITAVGVDGSSWERTGQMPIDEITPWLDEQSGMIMGDVFQRPGYGSAETKGDQEDIKDRVQAPTNPAILAANDDSYRSDTLNPQFRYEGGTQAEGRWRSQTFRFFSTSMVVEDGDGDGRNEVFILHNDGISAYRFNGGKLEHLDSMTLAPNTQYLRLEIADVNRDGIKELIVGTYVSQYRSQIKAPEGYPRSYILSFEGDKFKYLAKGIKLFLGVLRIPPTYMPVMVAQKKGRRHLFDNHMYEALLKDGEIVKGQPVSIPPWGNVYNMVYLPDGFGYRYVILDDFHKLIVYSQTMERLYSSDNDTFNSSGTGIEYSDKPEGMGPGTVDEVVSTYNVPFRMLTASLTTKGKHELLANKDLSIAAQFFERFKYYSQGEIHSLAWDGVGLNMAWKTRRIKGQVCDMALADLNNDGKKQLCVLLNTFPGGLGFSKRKTVVLAYDLNTD
ncbi:VCBS repeat-containing protein [Pseudodesulfovibrio cashew]|uniref:VCBS repeat-containing protein n=1 Tax=Pseudodesulfovibrio cashew TaxID=2678688 RepID=A0A6I6JCZ8_9BACT|nr:VCBS repeat-containing protein [Pseudodesulfovibrio cashew]QGY38948.1 VCBS repeat-containing protein [Pseudodesulfovibrio cashew]